MTSSGFRGVSYHIRGRYWRVKIKAQGKHIFLGNFANPATGARVWDVAAVLLRGPGTTLNFDGEPPAGVRVDDVRQRLISAGVLRASSV